MRFAVLDIAVIAGAASASDSPPVQSADSQSRYLGQKPPGLTPERFAPGIVSTAGIEINGVFAPDFREFVFARQLDGVFTLFRSTLEGSKWSAPQPLRLYPGGAAGVAVDMAISPDGQEMFFMGRYKAGVAPDERPFDIWMSRKKDGGWTTAETVSAPVSTAAWESYPTVVADGSLYFVSDRPGGVGRSDIYRAPRLSGGRFGEPVNIGRPANSEEGEGDPFASPDERYLIITSARAGGFGEADLYVSFRAARRWLGPADQSRRDDQHAGDRVLSDGYAGRPLPVLLATVWRVLLADNDRRRRVLGRHRRRGTVKVRCQMTPP